MPTMSQTKSNRSVKKILIFFLLRFGNWQNVPTFASVIRRGALEEGNNETSPPVGNSERGKFG